MRAWQVDRHGAPCDVLRLVDLEQPVPGPGEVRLSVRAAAIGRPDALMCRGTYPLTPPLPFVPGQEVCGVVEAVGTGVDLALGTRLMAVTNFFDGRGGFAESAIALAATCFRVPDEMSDVDAAAFRIGFSTAWIGLVRRAALQAGEWLVVLGAAGGSGAAAVQLGHALGARVVAVAAGAEKLDLCARLGAEVLVDRTATAVRDAVLEATDGHGADVVYDPVGGDAATGASRATAAGGRLLAVGFASGEWASISTPDLVARNASLLGVYAGGFTEAENDTDHEALLALAAAGRIGGFATAVDFDQIARTVELVAGDAVIGKYVARSPGEDFPSKMGTIGPGSS
ncbi:MAG: zinc-binding dehydrogenase [Acidimicrobiia bacterium]|nr:zinc-binding dehydrogenase [Acidimicrobiia bacterium]